MVDFFPELERGRVGVLVTLERADLCSMVSRWIRTILRMAYTHEPFAMRDSVNIWEYNVSLNTH